MSRIKPPSDPDNPPERPEPHAPRPTTPTLLPGAFLLTISPEGKGEKPFPDLIQFSVDGSVIESSPDTLSSTGIGAWQRQSGMTYLVKFVRFIYDPPRDFRVGRT